MANEGSRWDSLSNSTGNVTFDFENQDYVFNPTVPPPSGEEEYVDSTTDTSVADKSSSDTEAKAEKKKLKNDIYTLVGTVNVNVSCGVVADLKTAKTVTIDGVGTYLSGTYLIKNRSLSISGSGISVSIEVIKTGFEGDQINGGAKK